MSTIVIKVGTSTLTLPSGELNLEKIGQLADVLTRLRKEGNKVLLVTSGAVGIGRKKLGLATRPQTIPEKQAVAAVGQGLLIKTYEGYFSEKEQVVAQVLLSKQDVAQRENYLNARNTLETLLAYNVIPIINENDTVATDELKFGDNDTLAAMVASLVNADLLVILTDIEGLYTANPKSDPNATLIPRIDKITPEVEALAGGAGTDRGTGGMITKLQAAKIAMASGVKMVIMSGKELENIGGLLEGKSIGTTFEPSESPLESKKRWLAFHLTVKGKIVVDAGAEEALVNKGKSLLPAGVLKTEGEFGRGDLVEVCNQEGKLLARGLTNYSSIEVEKLKGLRSGEIEKILGHRDYDEVIHRDNMARVETTSATFRISRKIQN